MTLAQVGAVALVVASALNAYLLTQTLVVVDPIVQLVLGAANVVLVTLSLYLKVELPGRTTPS